jgi:predicted nicotinamide N-methyase
MRNRVVREANVPAPGGPAGGGTADQGDQGDQRDQRAQRDQRDQGSQGDQGSTGDAAGFEMAPAPPRPQLEALLELHAPLRPVALCPEVRVHQASSLVAVWEAAEALAGLPLPAPFWAYAWAGGTALARVLLDEPERVRGSRVLDFGGGGGVAALAAARAGGHVTLNDIDPWALLVARIAAERQGLSLEVLQDDVCANLSTVDAFDVVLCSDLAYERSQAPRQRRVLERAAARGAAVLVADAGRKYFDPAGMTLLAEYEVAVPRDLEGTDVRTARVYAVCPPRTRNQC